MKCLVCGHGTEGEDSTGALRVQITEVGDLDPELRLPPGGIDGELCEDCWSWTHKIAEDPEALLLQYADPKAVEADGGTDD